MAESSYLRQRSGLNKRKICPYCDQYFANSYIAVHQENCTSKQQEMNVTLSSHSSTDDEDFDGAGSAAIVSQEYSELESTYFDGEMSDSDDESVIVDEAEYKEIIDDFFHQDDQESIPNNDKIVFIFWMCRFLSLWQYYFNITDSCLEMLIKFIKVFFSALAKHFHVLKDIALSLPTSLYTYQSLIGCQEDKFIRYVVCTKCHKLYKLSDAFTTIQGEKVSQKCSNVLFPQHPRKGNRKPCGQSLMKSIESSSGKKSLVPVKVYCYMPLERSLTRLLQRPDIVKQCEHWRNREYSENILSDVYDGRVWKEFSNVDSWNFFSGDHKYAVMLNYDGFCPFKHVRSFSVGAIYAVLLNLPRSIRFKKENVLLIGLIPNMAHEPPTNSFLQPLVDELLCAWNDGFNISLKGTNVNVKCALLCVGCDIPASRKLCGFLGHSARMGCNKCKKQFPGGFGAKNYGGFKREEWIPRSKNEHREEMKMLMACVTKTERSALESIYGTRFTVLVQLPYFDCIRMTILDPMHNLFLGTSRRMITIWKELGYLNKQNLSDIQKRVDSAICPNDVGKLPCKIEDFNFDGFTADELKNWTILFSMYALKGILPEEHLKCWQKFVLACCYLCNHVLVKSDLLIADNLLLKFCQHFEELYGSDRVTPNMHMHGHLVDSVKDYGPVYNFWLFSFERYNGILSNIPNNSKNVEMQLMRRFDRDISSLSMTMPVEFSEEFSCFFESMQTDRAQRGTLGDISHSKEITFFRLSSRNLNYAEGVKWHVTSGLISLKRKLTAHILNETEFRCLTKMYQSLYSTVNIIVGESYWKTSEITLIGETYGSQISRSVRSSYIMSYWCGKDGIIQPYNEMYLSPHPARVLYYLKHSITVGNHVHEHMLACVEWFLPVHDKLKNFYGKPVEVYRDGVYVLNGGAIFLPVQRIRCKFVKINSRLCSLDVVIVLPRNRFLNL